MEGLAGYLREVLEAERVRMLIEKLEGERRRYFITEGPRVPVAWTMVERLDMWTVQSDSLYRKHGKI